MHVPEGSEIVDLRLHVLSAPAEAEACTVLLSTWRGCAETRPRQHIGCRSILRGDDTVQAAEACGVRWTQWRARTPRR